MVMTYWGVVPGRAFVFYGPFADDGISDADKAGSSDGDDATTPAPVTDVVRGNRHFRQTGCPGAASISSARPSVFESLSNVSVSPIFA